MTTIYLIRHAEAEGNLYRRVHGWYDSLITENGYLQIAALERRFADTQIDAVYASDLFRTQTTAQAVVKPRGIALHTDPGLREVNLGDWEDLSWGEIRRTDPEALAQFNNSDPNWRARRGESLGDVGERMEAAVRRIVAEHPDQTLAIFSHGTAIRQFLANVKGLKPEQWHTLSHSDNTAVTCLAWNGERFHQVFENDNSHLPPSISTLARQGWWRKEGRRVEDVNLWFRPLDLERERQIYYNARREAWATVHGDLSIFDGDAFVEDAKRHCAQTPWGVTCAMAGERVAGLLQLDPQRYSQDGAGYIPFCYMAPDLRTKGLGVQLIGQAVSFYRPLGRQYLRLRCASYNAPAQGFYRKYGFYPIGVEQGSKVPLDILEKYIGYDREHARQKE